MTKPARDTSPVGFFLGLLVYNLLLKFLGVLALNWWLVLTPLWIILAALVLIGLASLAPEKK